MKKHTLVIAALTAGLLFGATPPAHAFSPFGLMAALASASDSDDMSAKPENTAADATAHNEIVAADTVESRTAGTSPHAPAARETDRQAKYSAAVEPAAR